MPLSRRYMPEWPPGEKCSIGMSFEYVVPPGVSITFGSLFILLNSPVITDKSTDFTSSTYVPPNPATGDTAGLFTATVSGRTVYIPDLKGGIAGTDYQFDWEIETSDGNQMLRTALLLCAPTS
jgi:hypothetical protein